MAPAFCAMRITGHLLLRIWPRSSSRLASSSSGESTLQSSHHGPQPSPPHTDLHETPGTLRVQVADRAVGPRLQSPLGWFPLRTRVTVAVPSASRQVNADWWDSSPRAAGSHGDLTSVNPCKVCRLS